MEAYYAPQIPRLRRWEEMELESTTFGNCDCTSYSYFALSLALISVGTVITVLALGDAHGLVFSTLGHMWLVGPIFISSGLMVAVKSVIYLRKKSLIQMIIRQRALIRNLQELARQSRTQQGGCMLRNASAMTLPPSYDSVVVPVIPTADASRHGSGQEGIGCGMAEAPPPTYEEAVFLLGCTASEEKSWRSNGSNGDSTNGENGKSPQAVRVEVPGKREQAEAAYVPEEQSKGSSYDEGSCCKGGEP